MHHWGWYGMIRDREVQSGGVSTALSHGYHFPHLWLGGFPHYSKLAWHYSDRHSKQDMILSLDFDLVGTAARGEATRKADNNQFVNSIEPDYHSATSLSTTIVLFEGR